MSIAWIVAVLVAGAVLGSGVRRIPETHRASRIRLGRRTKGISGPGLVYAIPFVDRLEQFSVEPFSVSLPPQSAITSDEIPLQLQASLDARVGNLEAACMVKDWRISVMSLLQNLMKDRLEELDFDRLQTDFPDWVRGVRSDLDRRATEIGVEITGLQISNMSPRTRPSE